MNDQPFTPFAPAPAPQTSEPEPVKTRKPRTRKAPTAPRTPEQDARLAAQQPRRKYQKRIVKTVPAPSTPINLATALEAVVGLDAHEIRWVSTVLGHLSTVPDDARQRLLAALTKALGA